MRSHLRPRIAGLAVCAGLASLAGCTAADQTVGFVDKGVPAGSFQLVAFDSCDEALSGLRAAAKSIVGPYGFWSGGMYAMEGGVQRDLAGAPGAPQAAAAGADSAKGAGAASTPNYSGTNTHEAGVDEPDLVKTDGRRIVTVSGGILRVVDAAGRDLAGFVDLADSSTPKDLFRYTPADLLLSGDRALVLLRQEYLANRGGPVAEDVAVPGDAPGAAPGGVVGADPQVAPLYGPRLILVDLSGQPRVLSSVQVDGGLIDARQVGSTARVVIRSYPRMTFPYIQKATDGQRVKANQSIIDQAPIERWLPRIEVTTGGTTQRPQIGCDAISRPAVYTGTNLLTVLSFDLGESALGDGRPTTLVADGDTVYSNGPSLYVSSDQRWRALPEAGANVAKPAEARTEIYKFDTSTAQRPTFVAGGSVPGYVINQYAMSEWDGMLRVATTTDATWNAQGKQQVASQSGVYVLSQSGKSLRQVGKVEGLGKGERIYAVRFAGPVGYVVTFRQTDPLYTLDLGDPAKPQVRGALKIPGYSAYLHPAGGARLIGIGQDATDQGRVTGTQVSLFDVGDLAAPSRLAQYKLSGANSEAEFDPHAFLYWPEDGLLVVPLQVNYGGPGSGGSDPATIPQKVTPSIGALVLRVTGASIYEVGFIRHPESPTNPGYSSPIRRSLIIDQTLWTVSDGGLMATDSRSLVNLAWIPFN